MADSLVEVDSVEVVVIVDNEVDPMSPYKNTQLAVSNRFIDFALKSPYLPTDRGEGVRELRMHQLCCGAHGLSLMITAVKGDTKRTLLFDTAPEEQTWEINVDKLALNLSPIELIHLSHWHRDHSGGMLRAIKLINADKEKSGLDITPTIVDLHPDRPDYRGFLGPLGPISLEADPSFEEIAAAGGKVEKNDGPHTVLDGTFLISGEIPRVTEYEVGLKRGLRFSKAGGQWTEDTLIRDERLVMCKVKDRGIIMFTGCSHAGVVNASKHAVELGKGAPLYAVVGGYHLADAETPQMEETVKHLKALDVKVLVPGHCSGWRVKMMIENEKPGWLAPSTVGTKFIFSNEVGP